jgi:two-component system response regulator YesN
MKVTAIAENVGFDNSSYFTKIFKRETGLTPAEYRKSV